MKIFCAYAFTGNNREVITKRMQMVVETLRLNGHQVYCDRFDPSMEDILAVDDIQAIFKKMFDVITASDALVAIVTTPDKSVGQIMEIGTTLSQNKPMYLFEHESAKDSTYLRRLASKYYAWNTEADLLEALKQI